MTIQTLIALADDHNPSACWDDRRAEDLLRKESTAEECRTLGMSERMIAHVFGAASQEECGERDER